MSGFYRRILALTTLISVLAFNISTASAIEISGKLVLPATFSPVGEMKVFVRATNQNGAGYAQQLITIPDSTPGGQ